MPAQVPKIFRSSDTTPVEMRGLNGALGGHGSQDSVDDVRASLESTYRLRNPFWLVERWGLVWRWGNSNGVVVMRIGVTAVFDGKMERRKLAKKEEKGDELGASPVEMTALPAHGSRAWPINARL